VAPQSSHEGRRHHFRPREGRRQRFRPIDGQPRYGRMGFTQGYAALSSSRRSGHHIRPTKVADTTFVYEKVAGRASILSTDSLDRGASVSPPGARSTLVCTKVVAPHSSREGRRHHCRPR
jgi:hypothetical protein